MTSAVRVQARCGTRPPTRTATTTGNGAHTHWRSASGSVPATGCFGRAAEAPQGCATPATQRVSGSLTSTAQGWTLYSKVYTKGKRARAPVPARCTYLRGYKCPKDHFRCTYLRRLYVPQGSFSQHLSGRQNVGNSRFLSRQRTTVL